MDNEPPRKGLAALSYRLIQAFWVAVIVLFLAYEVFGWVPPLPGVIKHSVSLAMQTLFAIFVSAVIFAWAYFFLMWVKRQWIRISVAALLGLYIGFSATFNPGISSDLVNGDCRPAGPGIYNDC